MVPGSYLYQRDLTFPCPLTVKPHKPRNVFNVPKQRQPNTKSRLQRKNVVTNCAVEKANLCFMDWHRKLEISRQIKLFVIKLINDTMLKYKIITETDCSSKKCVSNQNKLG